MSANKIVDVADAPVEDTGLCNLAYLAAMKLNELYEIGPGGDALVMALRRLGDRLEKRTRHVERLCKPEPKPKPGERVLRLVCPGEAGATAS